MKSFRLSKSHNPRLGNLTKSVLTRYLCPNWPGKWDAGILGKYLTLREMLAFARLKALRRWSFHAVPSVRKTGITIELRGRGVADKHLAAVSRLRMLHVLILADCRVTDDGLAHLTHLTSLECLVLARTAVTDAGLVHLRALPGLQTLDVDGTAITDASLEAAGLLAKKFSLAELERQSRAVRAAAPSGATPVMVEIAEMNRRLAALRPAACLPDFAVSLNNLGWGRHTEDSLRVFREAIEIYRRLMQTDGTEKHAGGLYATLGNLGGALESLGRTEEARAAIQEAVDVYRQIPSAPAGTELAFTLHRLGRLNGRLERNEEALQATREAAEIYRRKVVELPTADMLRSWYVETLIDLAALLRTMGRQDEALATAEEAVAEARSPSRIATGRNLERSLQLLAEVLADLGHDDEARAVAEEAAELERRAANR